MFSHVHRAQQTEAAGANPQPIFVGIDVFKDKLDLALSTTGDVVTLANTKAGVAALVKILASIKPTLTVIEATFGYERFALDALPLLVQSCSTFLRVFPVLSWAFFQTFPRLFPTFAPLCQEHVKIVSPGTDTTSKALPAHRPLHRRIPAHPPESLRTPWFPAPPISRS